MADANMRVLSFAYPIIELQWLHSNPRMAVIYAKRSMSVFNAGFFCAAYCAGAVLRFQKIVVIFY